ncbi:MAG: mechanosensitive ion channel [Saprospiraceae bacterium]|nr:mechanosensitive ion channel [Saprospiraceae bacterium]
MDQFFADVWSYFENYYDQLVAFFPKLMIGIIVLLVFRAISGFVLRKLRPLLQEKMDDPLLARFLVRIVKVTFFIIGFLLFLHIIGFSGIAAGILGTAGVSAFVIGFALKDIFEHFLAGFLLAFNRPFRIGDIVELDGNEGTVVALNMRNTHIKSFNGQDVYIPNGNIIKNAFRNYTIDGFLRQDFDVGLEFGADLERASEVIIQGLQTVNGVLQEEKAPFVNVASVGSQVVKLAVYYWLDTFDKEISGAKVKIAAVNTVLEGLQSEGFYLPGDVIEIKNEKTFDGSTKKLEA